jgi:hypothetical protein
MWTQKKNSSDPKELEIDLDEPETDGNSNEELKMNDPI